MHRLFIGLVPAPSIRAACCDSGSDGPPGWAWQDDDQLHLTLRFIGAVERRQAEDIAAAIEALVVAPPGVGIDGVGWFDQGARGALFARAAPRPALAALHRKLDRLVVSCGLAPEGRAYLPHITLARRRAGAVAPHAWLERHAGLSVAPAAATALALFESRIGRHGSSYERVATATFNV